MYIFDKNGNEVRDGDLVYFYGFDGIHLGNHVGKILGYSNNYSELFLVIEPINTSSLVKRSPSQIEKMKDTEAMLLKLESEGYDR